MHEMSVLIGLAGLAVIALFTRRLERSPVTSPMLCVLLGGLFHWAGGTPFSMMLEGLTVLAEVALAVVLFTDAAHLKLARLNERKSWALRLLFLGILLSFGLGILVLMPLFPEIPIGQIALVAALLAPTDAALGQAILNNKIIPEHIRDTLTAESGLNDGLALPLIIFLACATVGFEHNLAQDNWYLFAGQQIGFGLAVGVVIGAIGGMASHWSAENGFAVEDNTAIFGLILIAVTYFAAEAVGGNSFVAVFSSGLLFGRFAKSCANRAKEFLETDGVLLMMVTFFYIGAIMLPQGLVFVNWQVVAAVALSLFLVRPLAVWLAMIGTDTTLRARLFLGWFGPRGLATALFTLVILNKFGDGLDGDFLLSITMGAFLASTVLHGISAHYAGRLWGEGNEA